MNTSTFLQAQLTHTLPSDHTRALLIGRLWLPGTGPVLVTLHDGHLHDVSPLALTSSGLLALPEPAAAVREALAAGRLPVIASWAEVLANAEEAIRDAARPWLLAPIDLQSVKAAGVTFA
ncbi:MAG: fumarylacetoacetate hydrolase, partial [Burkholderiales bacterium]|nr:fumarylacetoacetate hydrolase [Burkholderiales bacterium]